MSQNNVLLLKAIASVRKELKQAHERKTNWFEIGEIMQRLVNLYGSLEVDELAEDQSREAA